MTLLKHPTLVALAGAALVSGACLAPPVETPQTIVTQETSVRVEQNIKNKVDILFVIDNSPSMKPKQAQLAERFPTLINVLASFGAAGSPASYHVGVVTSDLGANTFVDSLKQCQPGGDAFGGGRLQAKGEAASSTCKVVTGGVKYIDFNQLDSTDNLPSGQDLATTFGCMADVGDIGCGFEQTLEAAYQALKNTSIDDNAGFLRNDAILAVVFVTDEDDCSAASSADIYNPMPSTPPDSGGLGLLNSYRCNKFGHVCDDPNGGQSILVPYGPSGGQLQNCRPATEADGGKLYDVERYINLFTKPVAQGGVKVNPEDVILVAISADPAGGYETILGNPTKQDGSGQPEPCTGPLGQACAVLVKHSCVAPSDLRFFGDPAVRIKKVVDSAKNHQFTSICDTDYTAALQALGELIVSQIGAGCLGAPITNPDNPDCVVEDVQTLGDGSTSITKIDPCGANGFVDKSCWKLTPNTKCKEIRSPINCGLEQFGMTIDRGPGGQPPANTTARVFCNTVGLQPGEADLDEASCKAKNGLQ